VPTYSLPELARLGDVTPRTIRYYIAQGLLPAPETQGRNTRYTDEHLARLRAIKKLQAAHFPLAEIRSRLRAFTTEELGSIAESVTPARSDSAADYIRSVLERPRVTEARAAYSLPVPSAPAAARAPAMEPTEPQSESPVEPHLSRSQWERIPLDPDIELHVRRPLTRQHNKRVERLIAIARELFEED
jgi:DNA-binding transcriptional MerR regulator